MIRLMTTAVQQRYQFIACVNDWIECSSHCVFTSDALLQNPPIRFLSTSVAASVRQETDLTNKQLNVFSERISDKSR